MKIIDLINKINNNEEVPEKVKFEDVTFEYSKEQKDYIHKIDEDGWINETLLFKVMNTHFISDLLRTEVEVIEENKEIERIDYSKWNPDNKSLKLSVWTFILIICDKINELVRAVNKLNKESK